MVCGRVLRFVSSLRVPVYSMGHICSSTRTHVVVCISMRILYSRGSKVRFVIARACVYLLVCIPLMSIRPHASAYVSIRQHYVSIFIAGACE